jgi:hypothetical protein
VRSVGRIDRGLPGFVSRHFNLLIRHKPSVLAEEITSILGGHEPDEPFAGQLTVLPVAVT